MKLAEGSSLFLDLVRAGAAQMVVFGHAMSYFGIFNILHEPNIPWMQNIAVVLFFILSGFIISHTVAQRVSAQPTYGFYDYFVERFSRVFSAFIPALVLVLLVDFVSRALAPDAYRYMSGFDAQTFVANLFMLQDYPFSFFFECCTSFGSARPFWTIAVEWWIYMFYGFLVLVLARRATVQTLLIGVLLAAVPFFHATLGRGNGLAVVWFFGVIMYLLISDGRMFKVANSVKVLVVLLSLFAAAFRSAVVGMTAYDPIFAFLLALALIYCVDLFSSVTVPSTVATIVRAGAGYSFTLYLVHYTVLDFLDVHFKHINPYVLFAVGLIVSNVLGYYIALFTEQHLTRWVRQRLKDKRSGLLRWFWSKEV